MAGRRVNGLAGDCRCARSLRVRSARRAGGAWCRRAARRQARPGTGRWRSAHSLLWRTSLVVLLVLWFLPEFWVSFLCVCSRVW